MTCKDCLHFDVCYVLADNPEEAEVEGAETDCSYFADRSRYVVREKSAWEKYIPMFGVGDFIKCSVCGKSRVNNLVERTNFCPNCGADMRKGENDGNDH